MKVRIESSIKEFDGLEFEMNLSQKTKEKVENYKASREKKLTEMKLLYEQGKWM